MISKDGKKTTLQVEVDKVTKLIGDEIYTGHRFPHERLVEKNLMDNYSASRVAIRQALHRLESIGLVNIEPHKGAIVAPITTSRIREEYQIVAGLEGYSTKLAIENISKADIRKLVANLEEQLQVSESNNQKWQALNKKFHKTINRNCGNPKLIRLIGQHIQFTNYWFLAIAVPGFHQQIEYHQKILSAITEKDGELARKYMEEHIMAICDSMIDHIQQNIPLGAFK